MRLSKIKLVGEISFLLFCDYFFNYTLKYKYFLVITKMSKSIIGGKW